MKYAYFPGCSMGSTAKCYRLSTDYVTAKMGMQLIEIKDWNCCGATSGHVTDAVLGLSLPARTLALAEEQEPDLEVATGCAACYARLKNTVHQVRKDPAMLYRVQQSIQMDYQAKNDVVNFLDIFSREEAMEAIRENITRPLTGLKVACYYGCLNVRPGNVTKALDAENPMAMDDILALAGVEPISWGFKVECCGAAHQNDAPKETRPLVERIIRNAQACGAEAIATACPLCAMNLEMRQKEYNRKSGMPLIPVYSFTELLAVAMGASAKRIALEAHYVPSCKVLAETIRRNRTEEEGGVEA